MKHLISLFSIAVFEITLVIIVYALMRKHKMTAEDVVMNIWYKFRFWFYRHFYKSIFRNSSPHYKGKKMVFYDDFTEVSWNPKDEKRKWDCVRWGQFHPDDHGKYYGLPELVNGGYGKFISWYNPQTFQNTKTGEKVTIPIECSTLTTTNESFKGQYGRFECRMTLPGEIGAWPAFWIWGQNKADNDEVIYSEIDCGEWYGETKGKSITKQCINLHWWQNHNKFTMKPWKVKIDKPENATKKFHEYVFEWRKHKIECFTDGVKIFQFSNKKILNKFYNPETNKLWLVINAGIDSDIVTGDDMLYRSEFLVDYIRIYE